MIFFQKNRTALLCKTHKFVLKRQEKPAKPTFSGFIPLVPAKKCENLLFIFDNSKRAWTRSSRDAFCFL